MKWPSELKGLIYQLEKRLHSPKPFLILTTIYKFQPSFSLAIQARLALHSLWSFQWPNHISFSLIPSSFTRRTENLMDMLNVSNTTSIYIAFGDCSVAGPINTSIPLPQTFMKRVFHGQGKDDNRQKDKFKMPSFYWETSTRFFCSPCFCINFMQCRKCRLGCLKVLCNNKSRVSYRAHLKALNHLNFSRFSTFANLVQAISSFSIIGSRCLPRYSGLDSSLLVMLYSRCPCKFLWSHLVCHLRVARGHASFAHTTQAIYAALPQVKQPAYGLH